MAPLVNGPVVIVAATRDRAAVGRGVVGFAVAAVLGGGLLISQLGGVAATVAAPSTPVRAEDGQLVVPAAANGQCFVDIQINETRFRGIGILDSGADQYLTLGINQARQAGLEVGKFTNTYKSANGVGRFARTRVATLRIADTFAMRNVIVDVTAANQTHILVGIQILRMFNLRLRSTTCELGWT